MANIINGTYLIIGPHNRMECDSMGPDKEQHRSNVHRAHKITNLFLICMVVLLIGAVLISAFMVFTILTNDSSVKSIPTSSISNNTSISDNTSISNSTSISDYYSGLDVAGLAYEKYGMINGSTDGDQYDYHIRLVVHRGYGTDQGQHVYLSGRFA